MADRPKATKKDIEYRNQYTRDNYDRLSVLLPKGRGDQLKEYAKKESMTTNQFVNVSIQEKMERIDERERAGTAPTPKVMKHYLVDDCTLMSGEKNIKPLEIDDREDALFYARTEWEQLSPREKRRRDHFELIYCEEGDYDNAVVIKKFR